MGRSTQMDLADPVTDSDHLLGPSGAAVMVVEYGDFECPRCKQAAPAVELLLERFPKDVRFAYRHFPLVDAHPHALDAAQAAECAAAQGKFWEMHRVLFANQTQLETNHLRSYAEQLELDVGRFTSELKEGRYLELVRAQIASGQRSGVRGSPGFLVNGRIQDVSFGMYDSFSVQHTPSWTTTNRRREHVEEQPG